MSIAAYVAKLMIREREKASMTQAEVASRLVISDKLYGHYENVRRVPTLDALQRLDALYGYQEIELFTGLHDHIIRELELPAEFLEYFEQEALASKIRVYDPLLIPGLFQTENYAREVLRAGQREDRLEQMVSARMGRQEILSTRYRHPSDRPPGGSGDVRNLAQTRSSGGSGEPRVHRSRPRHPRKREPYALDRP